MTISGTEIPTQRMRRERTVPMQQVGGNQVAMGLMIQDEAQHIVGIQLINYGSTKGNWRIARLLPK